MSQTRSVRFDPGEYRACLETLTAKTASDIATAHKGMYSWGHRYGENVAMAAWWQSLSEAISRRRS
jgi:hypothetical protein